MALPWNTEVLDALQPILEAGAGAPAPAVGDVATRRANSEALFGAISATVPETGVSVHEFSTTSADGAVVPLRLYRPVGPPTGSLVVYLHGGGMILGSLDTYDAIIKANVAAAGVPFLAPEYRLAPEHPYPTPVEDCYAALLWAAENADDIGVDGDRIAVAGDSAGGGLAAGVALLARDRQGPALARQILIYPMLDDRTTSPDPALGDVLTWSFEDNVTGWSAYLGPLAGGEEVPAYAAPARVEDLSGLPRTYLDVGGLDIFRDEDLAYAQRLWKAGVETEIHVHPGVPHAFEVLAGQADVSRRVLADRARYIAQI